jgi:FRG domain
VPIATKTLTSWDEIHQYDKRAWIYRGQSTSKDRAIKTSIERFFEREIFQVDQRERLESELIEAFMRAYYNYALHVPADECIVEWLSLLQHHGAPTRCVDFT